MNEHGSFQYVHVGIEYGVATLTLNRPEVLNACNMATHREIQGAIQMVEASDEVRSVIITGAGRAFCSGSDLREVGLLKGEASRRYIKLDFATKNCVAGCSKPVIAALHGHVAGGGFELALACDIRFVSEDVLFSLPEILLGTIPGAGGLQRLPQVVGLGVAKEWVFSGRRIDANEAYLRGLANRICPPASLIPEAQAFARELAGRTSLSLALAKVALDPKPPAADGMIGIYHTLASQACHDDPMYTREAGSYSIKRGLQK